MKKSELFMLGKDKRIRYIVIKNFVVFLFLTLIFRLGYLQLYMGKNYTDRARNNIVRFKRKEAMRGDILDRNGQIIATTKIGYRLNYLNERKTTPKIVKEISEVTGYTEEYIEKRIKYGEISLYTRENILVEDLKEEIAHKIFEKIEDYPYIEIETYFKRDYLYEDSSSHSIGYVKKISNNEYEHLKNLGYSDKDVIGKDGIEKEYDSFLKGEKGYEYFEVNAKAIAQKIIDKKESKKGNNIQLTLDMRLQIFIENLFKEAELNGSLVAINPQNGEIITMVSYPTYSLNTFSSSIPSDVWNKILYDKRKPLTNKAIAGEYPPGSVFKPFVAFSFLENGLNPNETYNDFNGIFSIGEWSWKSWKKGGHGIVDMKKSIVESVNTYYYYYGKKYGAEAISETVKKFGLGLKTGIDIPGEKQGNVPTPEWKRKRFKESWYTGDTINYSIGQGYLIVTPLQVAQAYSVLANKGYAYVPRLLKKIESKDGDLEITAKKYLEVSYPKKYYDIMEEAMIGVVEEKKGTGKRLRTNNLKIAAKSGSAQNSQFSETHAWMAGYFPVENPEIVFAVVLQGAGGGGAVAGALAKRFIDEYQYLYNGVERPKKIIEIKKVIPKKEEPLKNIIKKKEEDNVKIKERKWFF